MRLVFKTTTSTCLLYLSGIYAFSPSYTSRSTDRITCPFQNTISHSHDTFSSSSSSSSSLKIASESPTSNYNTENDTETTTPPPPSNSDSDSFLQPSPNLIPQSSPKQPKLETEFYSMMLEFAEFTPKDIASIPDPRYRALYEGCAAGANEPLVMNAFSVIFQDLLPIRVAGRMIYRHLKSTMATCIEDRDCKEEKLVNDHGLDIDTINHGRRAFMAIMQEDDTGIAGAEGYMTLGALIETGIVDTVVELLEFDSFDEFVNMMDADQDEKITFEKFMVGLQNCKGNAENGSCDISCDLSEVLNEIITRMGPIEAARNEGNTDDRKKKFSDKYDFMVKTFEEWEELVPDGEGRMLEVLKGSFAGAKNAKIVKALKIVYMDYSALRVGGDLVFKLMGQLMKRRQKKQAS